MARRSSRVLSFIASLSASHRDSSAQNPAPTSPKSPTSPPKVEASAPAPAAANAAAATPASEVTPPQPQPQPAQPLPPSSSSQPDPEQPQPHSPKSPPDSVDIPSPGASPAHPASDVPSAASSATTPDYDEDEHVAELRSLNHSSSPSPTRWSRRHKRPLSLVQPYHPPVMAINEQTLPELQPIFTLLNSQSNKLYQEGYFLKLDDQDIRGHPNPDRTWTECFAQLVGTVLSLWDAAELDAAGEDGEVLPKFLNLTDASVKMIESLPTKSNDEQPLQNILSISTAGRNRYLLHFNSHHSLIQWTSAIRLAIFEHSTLQEAYTGALVAGKGKTLNSINIIMERARQPISEWVRVRFGAGVPWKRCFCVIEPPSEKEYQKAQKEWKKRNPYDRSHGPVVKGEIKFFDSRKEAEKKKKHQHPIATITDAYAAYAIYPQAKELIDSSTLIKIEGDITIHTEPSSSSEGFVFIMPETHPAVSGFEMMLRFLFPTWDTFALYGRPGRLVASSLDTRSLMFGMPKHKRHWYLDVLDVSGLVLTEGSTSWSEREWRKRMKELTGQRMATMDDEPASTAQSRSTSRNSKRLSYGNSGAPSRPRVGFADDAGSIRSSRSFTRSRPGARDGSAPPDPNRSQLPPPMVPATQRHSRHISDPQDMQAPYPMDNSPPWQQQQPPMRSQTDRVGNYASDLASTPERVTSEDANPVRGPMTNVDEFRRMDTPEPVHLPPAFAHGAGSRPPQKPVPSPEMRRATIRLSNSTLSQIAGSQGFNPDTFEFGPGPGYGNPAPPYPDQRGLAVQTQTSASALGMNANLSGSREVLIPPSSDPGAARDDAPGTPPPPPRDPARLRTKQSSDQRPPGSAGDDGPPPSGQRTPPPPEPEHGQREWRSPSPQQNREPTPRPSPSIESDRMTPPASPLLPPTVFDYVERGVTPKRETPQRLPPKPRTPPRLGPRYRVIDQQTAEAMREDNASETSTPDYASSSRPSIDDPPVPQREERPRYGVLKTVGDTSLKKDPKDPTLDYEIPEIDFGRTYSYAAPLLAADKDKDKGANKHVRRASGLPTTGRKSPGPAASLGHNRQHSDDLGRRTVAWPGPSFKTLSTENVAALQQTLQGRSTPTPLYSHQRIPSSNTVVGLGASHSRQNSTDYLSAPRYHSRQNSQELLASVPGVGGTDPYKRPGSRGLPHSRNNSVDLLSTIRPVGIPATTPHSAGEISMHLSAREQEHVARVTGTPLIALASSNKPSPTQSGLVGAIESRERERAQMKQGLSTQTVAQAIDQRQREMNMQAQRAAQEQYALQQAQFATAQQLAGMRPQTPGGLGGMTPPVMAGGAPSIMYGSQPPRPQTPGAMSRMMSPPLLNDAPAASYAPSVNRGRMSPGRFPQQQQQQQQQQHPYPPAASYGSGRQSPGPGWALSGSLPHRPAPGGLGTSPSMGMGMGMGMGVGHSMPMGFPGNMQGHAVPKSATQPGGLGQQYPVSTPSPASAAAAGAVPPGGPVRAAGVPFFQGKGF